MKLPISWLKEFVSTDASVKDICDALVGVGFEVEEVINYGEGISGVVVGKIIDIKAHPDADKLRICSVDVGKEVVTIVTGASNVSVGDVVPVALDGAVLPDKSIKAAPLRGVMSYGMMCSGGELKISEAFVDGASVDGIMILDSSLTLGEDIVTALDLKETVLDVSITANRPDCHSILGLSREVATALTHCTVNGRSLSSGAVRVKMPSFDFVQHDVTAAIPRVRITSPDCPVYSSAMLDSIKIEKSPKWMQRRLFMCGINPINNVVDITNYVLLEIGQPLHAFDLSMIEGDVTVRLAGDKEKITALNGEEYEMSGDMTLICDDKKPLAIAGVMGGKYSGISDDTKAVFLESARFARGSVRTTSLKIGLRSDSSTKFERGVDYYSVEYGRKRALSLFEQLGAGRVLVDRPVAMPEKKVIDTTIDAINGLLGIEMPKKNMVEILQSLGMDVVNECRSLMVTIPHYREDMDNFTDLAEEIIRFYGYDKMEETFMPTAAVTVGGMTHKQKRIEAIKDLICSFGAYEIMTYSFTDEGVFDKLNLSPDDARRGAIRIINPISEDLSIMKTELVSGMVSVVATNLTRKNDNFRLFELARVYEAKLPIAELPDEKDILCVGLVGGKEDFYQIKNIFTSTLEHFDIDYSVVESTEPYLHPGMSADLLVGGKVVCSFGKLHPLAAKSFGIKKADVYVGYLRCEVITDGKDTVVKYKPLPKFPSVERDLAFVVEENSQVGKIVAAIKETSSLVGDVDVFDIYRGAQIEKGFKSVALKIKLVPTDKTLVDAEIAGVMTSVVQMIKCKFNAKVRE
ncbi:MAG: phenylalanine--tRNA ligase subunit beta [Clostridia bacterium]|nr:phenylalanine--tRNA ligase subunit beta [Clostridia bacterium]